MFFSTSPRWIVPTGTPPPGAKILGGKGPKNFAYIGVNRQLIVPKIFKDVAFVVVCNLRLEEIFASRPPYLRNWPETEKWGRMIVRSQDQYVMLKECIWQDFLEIWCHTLIYILTWFYNYPRHFSRVKSEQLFWNYIAFSISDAWNHRPSPEFS